MREQISFFSIIDFVYKRLMRNCILLPYSFFPFMPCPRVRSSTLVDNILFVYIFVYIFVYVFVYIQTERGQRRRCQVFFYLGRAGGGGRGYYLLIESNHDHCKSVCLSVQFDDFFSQVFDFNINFVFRTFRSGQKKHIYKLDILYFND